ncbi:hypothetical protein [uncultured Maribacter sp.]|uniref:hypothetical protein n=1 Tax=uncultured Maribacter sp. TaxID=431308 RepID=UPI0030DDD10F|tara:strand:- start:2121 stop:2492 length:372 start_codon:yes stop_codon:yes gene_type:complete
MKKILFTTIFSFLLFSCSEETTINSPEEYNSEAFESYEFKSLQSSYDEYVEIESSITEVFDKSLTSKLSKSELDSRQEAYVQKITQKMFEVKKKRDVFLNKFPAVAENMNFEQLRSLLRKENR